MADPGEYAPAGSSRSAQARESNQRIARMAIRMRFVSRVPFLCECADDACEEFVMLMPHEYDDARLLGKPVAAPGHQA